MGAKVNKAPGDERIEAWRPRIREIVDQVIRERAAAEGMSVAEFVEMVRAKESAR